MSFVSVTGTLGLPPAPSIFLGSAWGAAEDDTPLTFLDLPAPVEGPPPDPNALYCPPGAELYAYQDEGVQFLLEHPVALLGDEMGLGKSIQAITALRALLHRGEATRVLILSPKSILFDWYYKLRQWAPDLRTVPIEGPKRRRTWYWRCKAHVFLVGYETWTRDLKDGLVDPAPFDLVILDEVQRIKNPDTATHLAVAKLDAPRRWGLSGTPMENRVEELVAIFAYLKPGLLPMIKGSTPAAVRREVAPYVLRRRKLDVLQLPPKESRVVWLDLTPVQRMAYEALERAGVQTMRLAGQSSVPMLALALITKLKQVCNLDTLTGASAKMSFLEKELTRLAGDGEKALVFSQYPEKTLKPLLPRMNRFGAALFDGNLTDWNRQLLIHRFQQLDDPRVLAMSLKCGGVGITLTRANHVYHFDHWWNPAAAAQAEDRTHRIGQKKPVYVTTLLTRGTIEERIAELVEQKRELFRQVMDPLTDMEAGEELALGKMLTRDDLMGLFGLH
ncbi:MAG TPA: DEAD/DEAH box helicase [Symbiobacteriaceae bacterium]|jgi:SNF2 family DNA or RNA helicase